MSKDMKRAEIQARIDTLKFAFGNPGANLDPLITEECRATIKKLKRMDIENQINRADAELSTIN